MITLLLAFVAGIIAREYFSRPYQVLSPEAQELSNAMRETEIDPLDLDGAYLDTVYEIYMSGYRLIRYLDGQKARLLVDCGYTVAYCA